MSNLQIEGMHLFREHDDQFVMLIENITKEYVEEVVKNILQNISNYFVIEERRVFKCVNWNCNGTNRWRR